MSAADDTAFRQLHPVDVTLTNPEGHAAIRLLEPASPGERLDVVVRNAGTRAFWLRDPDHPEPRASSHHLELRFRPGIIDPARIGEVRLLHTDAADRDGARWDLSHQRNDDETTSLFLLRDHAVHIRAGERLHFTLANLLPAADVHGGTDTQVEAVLRRQPNQRRRYLAGDALRTIPIALHGRRGHPVLPLEPAWVGTDTILNDGETENELVLDLVNVSNHPLLMGPGGLDGGTRLVLSDVADHDQDPRRLSTATRLADMEVEVTGDGAAEWVSTVDDEGPRPRWHLRPTQPVTIQPGSALTLRFGVLVCDASSGPAYLTINHVGVDGFWDGQHTAIVRKAPLLFRRSTDEGDLLDHVGIGTLHPKLALSIGRDDAGLYTTPDGTLTIANGGGDGLRIAPGGSMYAPNGLRVGGVDINGEADGPLRFRVGNEDRLHIRRWGGIFVPASLRPVDIAVGNQVSGVKGSADGSLSLVANNLARLRINADGTVLVGDIHAADTMRIHGHGEILSMHNLWRPNVTWGWTIDSAKGHLDLQLTRSGRSGKTPGLSLLVDDDHAKPVVVSIDRLRIGTTEIDEKKLKALLALLDNPTLKLFGVTG